MQVAHTIAERSYDPTRRVGAIIVTADNSQVLSLGYNGNAKGLPNMRDSEVPGESGFIHAEQNALYKLDYRDPHEKIMYVTTSPCAACAKGIIQCDIGTVFYDEKYRNCSGVDILRQSGRVTVFEYNNGDPHLIVSAKRHT